MANRNFDNQRGRNHDDPSYRNRQQGYRSDQMSQFDDQSGQGNWSTGEDHQGSYGQMGGVSDAGSFDDNRDQWNQRGYGRSSDQDMYREGRADRDFDFNQGSARYNQRSENGYRNSSFADRNYGGQYSQTRGRFGESRFDQPSYGSRRDRWSNDSDYGRDRYQGPSNFARSAYPRFDYAQSGTTSSDDYGDWRSYGESRGFLDRASDEVASWFGNEDAARRREMDHRGRGPSNYTRSDERIREDANERLTHDARIDASNITVTVKDGEVTLDGTVDHRSAKRRAEDLVENLSGVGHVQNNLRVSDNRGYTATASSQSGVNNPASVKKS